MFRDHFYLLWLAAAVAAAAAARWRGAARRRGLTALVGRPETLSRLIPAESASRRWWKSALELGGLALLFLALAGPQWGVELVTTEARTHQILVAVDTSLSMTAEDIKPTRLEKAKLEMSLLLDQFRGQRVGVVAFAGEAALVCPMTLDLDAAKEMILSLEPGMVPVPGTAVGSAVRLASETLSRYPGGKSLVILTDGEDHESDPLGAASEAASLGVRIFAIGVGTPEGEPIPVKEPSGALKEYKKDRKGATVITRLGERSLAGLSERTGGAYFRAGPGENEALEIAELILRAEKARGVSSTSRRYKNRFLFPLALAFLMLLIEFLIPESGSWLAGPRQPARPADWTATGGAARAPLRALTLLLLPVALKAATGEAELRQGNKLYRQEQYGPALEKYSQAGRKSPKDPRPLFNAGDALYRLDERPRAAEAFKALAQSDQPAPLRSDAWYNLGNISFDEGDYARAVEAYRRALSLEPKNLDARHNLAVALRALKNPPSRKKGAGEGPKDQSERKNEKERPRGASTESPPPSPRPRSRPQDGISKEDAERILRAVSEKEKSRPRQLQRQAPRAPHTEQDW